MRFVAVAFVAILIMAGPAFAIEPMMPVHPGASATKARDINGFELGMHISEAAERVKVTYRQGELVQSTLGDIQYDFGICPSGKVYRIQSSQTLGNFIPDEAFTKKLQSQLFEKYGPTTSKASINLRPPRTIAILA